MVILAHGKSELGGRNSQQDEFSILELQHGLKALLLFDGHGSDGGKISKAASKAFERLLTQGASELADYLRSSPTRKPLPDELRQSEPFEPGEALPQLADFAYAPSTVLETALAEMFRAVDEEVANIGSIDAYMSGTTAIVVLQVDDRLAVATLGDGRVALVRQVRADNASEPVFESHFLNVEHTCNNKTEHARLTCLGASVHRLQLDNNFYGPLRIFKGTLPYPGLVVTRSIGDLVVRKLGVTPQPTVCVVDLTPDDCFLLIGSDGLWDAISNRRLVQLACKQFWDSPALLTQLRLRKAGRGLNATVSAAPDVLTKKSNCLPSLYPEPSPAESKLTASFQTCPELSSVCSASSGSMSSQTTKMAQAALSSSTLDQQDYASAKEEAVEIVERILKRALIGLERRQIDDNVTVIFALL